MPDTLMLGRKKNPFMSDDDGFTGNGALTDPTDIPGDNGPVRLGVPDTPAPTNLNPTPSQPAQPELTPEQARRKAYIHDLAGQISSGQADIQDPDSGSPSSAGGMPPQRTPQTPFGGDSPYAQMAAQRSFGPPELPKPSGWRRAAGALLNATPFGRPFAGLAEYGSKGLGQIEDYNRWEEQLPQQIASARTLTEEHKVQEEAATRRLAQEQLEENKRLAQQTADVNSADTFGKAGGIIQPAMTPNSNLNVPSMTFGGELPPPPSAPAQPAPIPGGQAPFPQAPGQPPVPAQLPPVQRWNGHPFIPPTDFHAQLPPPPQIPMSSSITAPGGNVPVPSAPLPPPQGQYNRMPVTPTEAKQHLARYMPTPTQQLSDKKAIEDDVPLPDEVAKEVGLPVGTKVSDAVFSRLADTHLKLLATKQPTEVSLALKAANGDPGEALKILAKTKVESLRPIVTNNHFEDKQESELKDKVLKSYTPAQDSAKRFNIMTQNYEDAVKNNDQQAMLSLLAKHIGMTMGTEKGSRMTKDVIQEAIQSRPWLQGIESKFDSKTGLLSGVTLTPTQMRQMVELGKNKFTEDLGEARNSAGYLGAKDDGPKRVPNQSTVNYYFGAAHGNAEAAKKLMAKDGWSVE